MTTTEPTPTRKRPALLVVAVLALVAIASIARTVHYRSTHESTDNAQVDGHIVPVLAKVGGYVVAVPVAENDSVAAGALVVQVDSTEYGQRLAQAEAEYAAAAAAAGGGGATGQAEAQVATASGARGAMAAQLTAARAQAARAQADLARGEELVQQQIISRKELDALRAAQAAAQAAVQAVEEQAAAAGATVTSAEAGLRLARARLDAARAMRDVAALQLRYTQVRAPQAGRVARKTVEVGQLVNAGQPLLSIVGGSEVWVTANFKETQVGAMQPGQTVTIDVDAYPGCEARGTVESIGSATGARFALLPPDNATGNFTKVVQRIPVRIAVTTGCGPARPLRPGLSVSVAVATR